MFITLVEIWIAFQLIDWFFDLFKPEISDE